MRKAGRAARRAGATTPAPNGRDTTAAGARAADAQRSGLPAREPTNAAIGGAMDGARDQVRAVRRVRGRTEAQEDEEGHVGESEEKLKTARVRGTECGGR